MSRPTTTKAKERDVYSTGEAARLCGVSQQTIIRCFDKGRLRGYRDSGTGVRHIPREALLQFMEANAIETEPVRGRRRVLIVSSDEPLADRLRETLGGADGAEIEVATNAWDAGVLTARTRPHLVVLDRGRSDVEAHVLRDRLKRGGSPHPVKLLVLRPRRKTRGHEAVDVVTKRVREMLGP